MLRISPSAPVKNLENTTFSRFFLCPNAQFSPMFSPYRLEAAFFVL